VLSHFGVPFGWRELLKRTARAVMNDDVTGLAAELAYYFFLALFPALLFLVALASYFPLQNLVGQMFTTLGGVLPPDVLRIVSGQVRALSRSNNGGLLTLGIVGAVWTASSGMAAVIDTLNHAYNVRETRPWWRVRLLAIALTIALALFGIVSFALVVAGPPLARAAADWFSLGHAFEITWRIAEWPIVFLLVVTALAIVYYYAPDAEQQWEWITPGSVLATLLWLGGSFGFRVYVTGFGSYNATYGAIAGVIVALLWFYITGFAVLVGAELNAELEHASPYGKDPGDRRVGDEKKAAFRMRRRPAKPMPGAGPAGAPAAPVPAVVARGPDGPAQRPALEGEGTIVPARRPAGGAVPAARPWRASRLILAGLIAAEVGMAVWTRLRRARDAPPYPLLAARRRRRRIRAPSGRRPCPSPPTRSGWSGARSRSYNSPSAVRAYSSRPSVSSVTGPPSMASKSRMPKRPRSRSSSSWIRATENPCRRRSAITSSS
jgi:membrane protein